MCLIKVADHIWTLEGDSVKMFTIPFRTRMTIIRLHDGQLWLHSPVAVTKERIAKVDALGEVAYLIAPNVFHHLFLGDWLQEYPDAKLWGSLGLEKKRPDLVFDGLLQDKPEPQWESEIDQMIFHGSKIIPEVIFLHKPSGTLIMTDLIQNHDPSRDNLFWRIIKRLDGILAPGGGVPRDLRLSIRNRQKAKEAVEKLRAWDFDRLIIGHGICIQENAKEYVMDAFSWLNS